MLRAEVLKNLVMFAPMMLLIAAISFGDGGIRSFLAGGIYPGPPWFFREDQSGPQSSVCCGLLYFVGFCDMEVAAQYSKVMKSGEVPKQ